MDRGIATQANIDWLAGQDYRYLVVTRERPSRFDLEAATALQSASKQAVYVQSRPSHDGKETLLYCNCEHGPRRKKA